MIKNPHVNAMLAGAYITLVASFMYYGPRESAGPDSVLAPIAFLSLFVLSAAVMGFLFLARPGQLYLDGKKDEAVSFFVSTLLTFAAFTALVLGTLFFMWP